MKTLSVWLPLVVAVASSGAFAQASATIDIDTTHPTPLNANFSGFNDEVVFPAEFFDYRLNDVAAQLSPGWVRYPSGSFSDAFDWQTGMMVPAWAAQFQGTNTATPESAGAMAAFAKANHIPVAVWELANEPYLYPGFFASGADYVAEVKPY